MTTFPRTMVWHWAVVPGWARVTRWFSSKTVSPIGTEFAFSLCCCILIGTRRTLLFIQEDLWTEVARRTVCTCASSIRGELSNCTRSSYTSCTWMTRRTSVTLIISKRRVIFCSTTCNRGSKVRTWLIFRTWHTSSCVGQTTSVVMSPRTRFSISSIIKWNLESISIMFFTAWFSIKSIPIQLWSMAFSCCCLWSWIIFWWHNLTIDLISRILIISRRTGRSVWKSLSWGIFARGSVCTSTSSCIWTLSKWTHDWHLVSIRTVSSWWAWVTLYWPCWRIFTRTTCCYCNWGTLGSCRTESTSCLLHSTCVVTMGTSDRRCIPPWTGITCRAISTRWCCT